MSYLIGILLVAVLWYFGIRNSKKREGVRQSKLPALAPIINGTSDTTGVTGTYADRPVRANVYSRRQGVGDDSYYEYFWSTSMQVPVNSPDWSVFLQAKILGLGEKSLKLNCKDEYRRSRLEALGLMSAVAQVPPLADGRAELHFSQGWLALMVRVKDDSVVPDPNEFGTYLEMLRYLLPFCDQV